MKRIIITGGNEGIGYSMVERLLEDGCRVTVLDLQTHRLEALRQHHGDSLLPIVCDVRDEEAVTHAVQAGVEAFGGVDAAIHNACKCTFESMDKTEYAIYQDVFDVNYFGALRLVKAVISHMQKAGKGKVILTSSGVGVMGFRNISPYASSKGAIEAFAKCMDIEYRDRGITFHIFHPPLTRTHSSRDLPVPKEFMADPVKVGTGLARRINKKSFVICHSFGQKFQVMACYLFPLQMGRLMSRMTAGYEKEGK
ncbi:MAG: SDR family NAD(P)-dependent oxidoreductase [Christensenellales bacterium]|jgi:NAD(P)-dependent dehydrogenase (short-subunit alcohol dehydrogenase family)